MMVCSWQWKNGKIKTCFIHIEGKGMEGSYSDVDSLNYGAGGITVRWGRTKGETNLDLYPLESRYSNIINKTSPGGIHNH